MKKKTEKNPGVEGREHRLDRPNQDDLVYSELNVEHWPELWNTEDPQGDEIQARKLKRKIHYPDGSAFEVALTIDPTGKAGDLTTQSLRLYSVLLKLRQEHLKAERGRGVSTPSANIKLSLRQVAKELWPGKTTRQRWGGDQVRFIKRHLRKLQGVNLWFDGAFWDATTERKRRFESGFSILAGYYISEPRVFQKGGQTVEQGAFDLGFFQLNTFLAQNLDRRYQASFYLSERLKIRSPFALLLYNFLNRQMAGIDHYERRLSALFEVDFPSMGRKYPAPSQRKRLLARNLPELIGRRTTTGVLESLLIKPTVDRKDSKLVVVKRPFPLRLASEPAEPQAPRLLAPRERPTLGADATDEEVQRFYLVEDILEVTRDPQSRRFYERVAEVIPEQAVRKLVAEIRAKEDPNFIGSSGKLFTVKLRQWCEEQGIEPFWERS